MNPIIAELLLVIFLTIVGALAGSWMAGQHGLVFMAVSIPLLFFLRQFWQIQRLIRWTTAPLGTPTPSASGAWCAVFEALEWRGRRSSQVREQATLELERFRRAAEALPEGVMILDGNRTIEWMNLHAEACLGLKVSTDIGARITHLIREPEFIDYLDKVNQNVAPLELRTGRNPGRALLIQLASFAAGLTLLLVRDVTQLQKLATMRRDFVANVSHELKTPLTVTIGFVETAIDALGDASREEIAGYLAAAAEQARRMQHLIEDLLTLSSLETDAPPPFEEPVQLAGLLMEVKREAENLSQGAHRIVLETDSDEPPVLLGSMRELRSAFANLAGNAVRYSPPGATITLRWAADSRGGGGFSVTDSGIGIAAEHIPRLTERFYRVDRGRSRDAGGTGLGLAIVKHVLERHQATLDIVSEPGKGSCFSAAFPPHRIQAGNFS